MTALKFQMEEVKLCAVANQYLIVNTIDISSFLRTTGSASTLNIRLPQSFIHASSLLTSLKEAMLFIAFVVLN